MAGFNRIVLVGNLTREPELRYTPSGIPVSTFTVAVNRPFTNPQGERETDFIRVVVWRSQAERCHEYLSKGSQVLVEGRLQIRTYEDREGIKRRAVEVIARTVQFLRRLKKEPPPEEVEEPEENEIDRIPLEGETEEDENLPF